MNTASDVELELFLLSTCPARGVPTGQEQLWESAVRYAANLLNTRKEELVENTFALKLRLALHFAPASAIRYDDENPRSRHRLIRDYLRTRFYRNDQLAEKLSRSVAIVLDNWDETRRPMATAVTTLRRQQKGRCAHCGFQFGDPATRRPADLFKPYHEDYERLTSPEVDHIDPVGSFGTNDWSNLQLLCRLCNQGKGGGRNVDVRHEAEYAAEPIGEIAPSHRWRVFYAVVLRDERTCRLSGRGASEHELTIELIDPNGGFVLTNLQTVALETNR